MCELLAMSARWPTTLHVSLAAIARHGGDTGPHRDGWGVGWMQDGDAMLVREPEPAHGSRTLELLQSRDPTSTIVLAHIRRATQGARMLRNTQPFQRELAGRAHLFAHNGMLPGIESALQPRWFHPVGDTDSEVAFCALLDRLRPHWEAGTPTLEHRLGVISDFAADLRELGPANFIYTDGELVFAHGHRRRSDAGAIEPPGLHLLCRRCASDGAAQDVVLVASVPLTDEAWRPLEEGEIDVLREGRLVRTHVRA